VGGPTSSTLSEQQARSSTTSKPAAGVGVFNNALLLGCFLALFASLTRSHAAAAGTKSN